MPLPDDAGELFRDEKETYTVIHKNVEYTIRPFDPASLACDQTYSRYFQYSGYISTSVMFIQPCGY